MRILQERVLIALFLSCFSILPLPAFGQGGIPLWTNFSKGGGCLALDASGNVFTTGWSNHTVTKISNAGVALWTNTGPSFDTTSGIAVDGDGNAIVTGQSSASGSSDYLTAKYSSAGDVIWINGFDGSSHGTDEPKAVTIDQSGNAIVTGTGLINGIGNEFATIKYSAAGTPLWTNFLNRSVGLVAYGVATDKAGNVIVTGNSATAAYSAAGAPLWTNLYPGHGQGLGIALDNSGNVFVTGSSSGTSGFDLADYATIKYSNAGVPLWTNRYKTPSNGQDIARLVALDKDNSVFVTGYSDADSISFKFATIKYSNAGVPIWTNRYGTPSNSIPLGLAVDPQGNAFVTGISGSGPVDLVTVGYSNSGAALWTNRYPGRALMPGYPSGVGVDAVGNVFVTGATSNGFVTLKYSSSISARLGIQRVNDNVVLNWSNSGFSLQSAPTANGTFTNVPGATSPYTNSSQSAQCYYRLAAD